MHRIWCKVILSCLSSLGLWSFSARGQLPTQPLSYVPSLDVAQYSRHEGNIRSANLIEGFLPFFPIGNNTLPFIDLRYFNPDKASGEGNVDFGIRHLYHQDQRLFGLYAGYDRFRSQTRHYYQQINVGAEYWHDRFFLGGNIYLPIGKKEYSLDPSFVDGTSGEAFLLLTGVNSYRYNIAFDNVTRSGQAPSERILPGADAEVGLDMTSHLALYAGGYYFHYSGYPTVLGPKVRSTYTFYRAGSHRLFKIFDRIRLEGQLSHDRPRGTTWYAGVRFTIGWGAGNPTHGLARHMADPIRRDMNVINGSSPGNESESSSATELYMIDGHSAKVDIVSNSSGRTIDAAVLGDVDIIGVRGDQPAGAALTLGSVGHAVTITGGQYSFEYEGETFTINELGNNGSLTSANNVNLFEVDGTNDATIQYITLTSATNDGFALENQGNAFGTVTVDHVHSNAPFGFPLTASATNATGHVVFTNNIVTLDDSSTANNSDLFIFGNDITAVGFAAKNSSQRLYIDAFSDNIVSVPDRLVAPTDAYAVSLIGNSEDTISFTNGVLRNQLSVNGATQGVAFATWNVNITGDVFDNQFIVSGSTFYAFGWVTFFKLYIDGGVTENNFAVLDNTDISMDDSAGWNFFFTDVEINDNVSHNTFKAVNNSAGTFADGWFQQAGTAMIHGEVSHNLFDINNNFDGGSYTGLSTNTSFVIDGKVDHNTFSVYDNDDRSWGWRNGAGGSVGEITNNQFDFRDNASQNKAVQWRGTCSINGVVEGNIINITDNHNAINRGFEVELDNSIAVVFEAVVQNNSITFSGSNIGSNTYGFYLHASAGGSSITFEENTQANLSTLNTATNPTTVQVQPGAGTTTFNGTP